MAKRFRAAAATRARAAAAAAHGAAARPSGAPRAAPPPGVAAAGAAPTAWRCALRARRQRERVASAAAVPLSRAHPRHGGAGN